MGLSNGPLSTIEAIADQAGSSRLCTKLLPTNLFTLYRLFHRNPWISGTAIQFVIFPFPLDITDDLMSPSLLGYLVDAPSALGGPIMSNFR